MTFSNRSRRSRLSHFASEAVSRRKGPPRTRRLALEVFEPRELLDGASLGPGVLIPAERLPEGEVSPTAEIAVTTDVTPPSVRVKAAAYLEVDGLFPGEQLPVDSAISAVAAGDVNGDGRLDLVAASRSGGRISVLLGLGDGTFQPPVRSAVGQRPSSVVLGDVNGDACADLIVTNSGSDAVSVLLGVGDGTFQTPVDYKVGDEPNSVVLGDVDRDGRLDLVTANLSGGSASVLLGWGDGTFRTQIPYAVGGAPRAATLGDVNGDGHLDLVAVNAAPSGSKSNVSVLLGRGDGTFETQVTYAVGDSPYAVALGDIDSDGRVDLVTANAGSDDVSVLLGRSDGVFLTQVSHPVGDSPQTVTVGDVNGDGHLDLVTGDDLGRSVSVLLGRGDGTFQSRGIYYSGWADPASLAVGDFNDDGCLDLVTATLGGVSILWAHGDGTFPTRQSYAVGHSPTAAALGDVNGDGRLDLVTAGGVYGGKVSVGLGLGDATFQTPVSYAVGGAPEFLALGDVNGDGCPDTVTADAWSNKVSVLLGHGAGTFQMPVTYTVGSSPASGGLGDVDGDGHLDVVTASRSSDSVSVLRGRGDGTFAPQVTYAVGGGPRAIALEDLNGDGRADLVAANSEDANVAVLLGHEDGTFQTPGTYAVGSVPRSIALADLDGDGHLDLVVGNIGSDDVSVLSGRGDGTFQTHRTYAVGDSPSAVALGDVNGDGRVDLVAANEGTSTISVLAGRGDGTFQTHVAYAVGKAPSSVVLGDLNGDGRLDLITGSRSGSDASVLSARGVGPYPTRMAPIHFTAVFSEPVVGFTADSVQLGGTAPGPMTASVTARDATSYDVAVSGMMGSGTVTARILAGAVTDAAGNPCLASASTDNVAAYDVTPPTVSVDRAVGQADLTSAAPIQFSVAFSEPVHGFAPDDLLLGGTAPGTRIATVTPRDDVSYDVAVRGMTGGGTVTASVRAGAALDWAGNPSLAVAAAEIAVTYAVTTVTVDQADGQADPANSTPLRFTVAFSEPVTDFTAAGVLLGGTAPGTLAAAVTPVDATRYEVAVSGMTGSGTVTVAVAAHAATTAAGHPNLASTGIDNAVTYDVLPPVATLNQAASLEAHGVFPGEQFEVESQPAAVAPGDLNGDAIWIWSRRTPRAATSRCCWAAEMGPSDRK